MALIVVVSLLVPLALWFGLAKGLLVAAAIGAPLVGDKLYGPDREIFLRAAAGEHRGQLRGRPPHVDEGAG